jgi:choline dehydrogenase-like flavoprotein
VSCDSTEGRALISARDQYEPEVLYPVYVGNDVGGEYDWNLATVPQTQLDGEPRPLPQGKVLGGGSILNGMVWHRAGADDYDAWNDLGATGWAWADLLPYFIKVRRLSVNDAQTKLCAAERELYADIQPVGGACVLYPLKPGCSRLGRARVCQLP